jgi:hypothetical protein
VSWPGSVRPASPVGPTIRHTSNPAARSVDKQVVLRGRCATADFRGMNKGMTSSGVALCASLLLHAASAGAAPFVASPVTGFGDQPALAQVAGATLASDGSLAVAGSSDLTNRRRAILALGGASAIGAARGFGPTAGAYDVALAANASGNVALTYSVGHVAYLTTCHAGTCGPTTRVGTSALKPQSAVAVQPGTGRTTVIWRGRSRGGVNRLQWRITTNGMLGRTHTLAEFGDTPKLATDMSGKTVAVWLATGRSSGRQGVRTAARRVGEFVRPTSLTPSPAAALRLVTSDRGSTVAAWLTAPNGIDPQTPSGSVQVATRTPATGFTATRSLGTGSTLALAGSPGGDALIVTDRHTTGSAVVVSASRRLSGGAFETMVDVSPAQFVSDAYGATGAIANGGRALVSWASAADPSAPAPTGVFASIAEGSGGFGAPQQLADARTATLPQPIGAAITPSASLVAWVGPQGGQVARADG